MCPAGHHESCSAQTKAPPKAPRSRPGRRGGTRTWTLRSIWAGKKQRRYVGVPSPRGEATSCDRFADQPV